MPRFITLLATMTLAACGSDPAGGPGPDALSPDTVGDDPGTGTGTLVVDGTAAATPSVVNSVDPANYTTDLLVRVTRAGVDVTDGTVSVTSTGGSVALLYDAATMRWHGAQAGYFEIYVLDIDRGTDTVHGVRVDGPDLHTFTAPTTGATVDSTTALPITWARLEPAEIATLRTRDLGDLAIPDSGTYTLAMGTLRSKPDQVEDEQLELTRAQRITPTGAAAGSTFRVSVRNRIALLVQPAP